MPKNFKNKLKKPASGFDAESLTKSIFESVLKLQKFKVTMS